MISKNQQKLIRSLGQKKYRQQNGMFVAEGPKVVGDLIKRMNPILVIATEEWINKQTIQAECEKISVSDNELKQLSFLQHPQQVMALFPLKGLQNGTFENNIYNADKELLIALDGIQDPGNLGTIIRIADWFGVKTILCSQNTADAYSPKVVQATMGSIARVNIIYCELEQTLQEMAQNNIPLYGTLLDGKNIYKESLAANGIIIMGNEGNGISENIRRMVTDKLLIPSFTESDDHAESLNVAIATAITLSEFRR